MTGRHAAPRRYPSRLWFAELASAGVLGSASLGMLAAPDATAAPTAPRETPEPTAAASYGPLELPSIGALPAETTPVQPSVISTVTKVPEAPHTYRAPATTQSTTPAPAIATPDEPTPAASETTQAATTTPPSETASATTTEATTTAPTTGTTATTTTAEISATTPTDPVGDLIDKVLQEAGP